MHSDPIADMLTRIRNAQAIMKPEVVMPYSKFKHAIADILLKEGWISGVEKLTDAKGIKRGGKSKKTPIDVALRVQIKYENNRPKISNIQRVSKPGHRVYASKTELPYVRSGYGIAIISTSQGLMTNIEARKKGFGGEVLCEIY